MEKRSTARELTFLALFQLPKNPEKLAQTDLHAICLSAVRSLSSFAKSNIKDAESYLLSVERSIMDFKVNHEENEPLDEATRSVPITYSDEWLEKIESCYQAINLLKESLQIPELHIHYNDAAVEDFAIKLLSDYINNREAIKSAIKEVSKSWDIDRMAKVDRIIIELACTEILYSDINNSVVASEALKLANKYSTEEGNKFINGILADIIKTVSD